jgi:hypothetical protein
MQRLSASARTFTCSIGFATAAKVFESWPSVEVVGAQPAVEAVAAGVAADGVVAVLTVEPVPAITACDEVASRPTLTPAQALKALMREAVNSG